MRAAPPWSSLSDSHTPSASWQPRPWCCHPRPSSSLQQTERIQRSCSDWDARNKSLLLESQVFTLWSESTSQMICIFSLVFKLCHESFDRGCLSCFFANENGFHQPNILAHDGFMWILKMLHVDLKIKQSYCDKVTSCWLLCIYRIKEQHLFVILHYSGQQLCQKEPVISLWFKWCFTCIKNNFEAFYHWVRWIQEPREICPACSWSAWLSLHPGFLQLRKEAKWTLSQASCYQFPLQEMNTNLLISHTDCVTQRVINIRKRFQLIINHFFKKLVKLYINYWNEWHR